jgi:hypothetical protein
MSLTEKIQNSVKESFDEQSRKIVSYERVYSEALEFMNSFSDSKMKEYAEKLGKDAIVTEALKETANNKRDELSKNLKGKSLEVEAIINSREGKTELFVPARYENGTEIEKEIAGHATSAVYSLDSKASVGRIGDYIAISADVRNAEELKKRLENSSDSMKLANIDMKAHRMSIPAEGEYQQNQKYILVKITPSAVDYKLIPLRKGARQFFPGYKQEFEILTPFGHLNAWVTSKTPEAPSKGNYICGSRRDGMLGTILEKMSLKPGDEIRIEEIIPRKKYAMNWR